MKKKLKTSGKITNNNAEYMFILTDFVLDIKLIKCNEKVSCVQKYPKYIINEKGFIKGITDNNEYIFFAIGNKDVIVPYSFRSIKIDFYIKFKNDYKFDKEVNVIKFTGGTLNQFARLDILEVPTNVKEESYLKVPYKNKNEKKVNVSNNTVNGKLIFRGSARSDWSPEDGISVLEEDASLYIETIVTEENIIKIFRYISNIFKFFTFRNNVGEFNIELMIRDDESKYTTIGNCFYKSKEYYMSNKSSADCISIKQFNEEQLKVLLDLLYIDEDNENKNSKVFSYDFINDDEHSTLISKSNVKDTITAFECTEKLIDAEYDINYNTKLDDLKKEFVNIIDNYENGLSSKEKEKCKKYIDKIGKKEKDIKERLVIQYNNYKNYLNSFAKKHEIESNDLKERIEELVKYRHKHTHNDVGVLTQELVNTTFLVQALIYCMILKKVGISDDNINYILKHCIC